MEQIEHLGIQISTLMHHINERQLGSCSHMIEIYSYPNITGIMIDGGDSNPNTYNR